MDRNDGLLNIAERWLCNQISIAASRLLVKFLMEFEGVLHLEIVVRIGCESDATAAIKV